MASQLYGKMENTERDSVPFIMDGNNGQLPKFSLPRWLRNCSITKAGRMEILFPLIHCFAIVSFYVQFYAFQTRRFSKNFLQNTIGLTDRGNDDHEYINLFDIE